MDDYQRSKLTAAMENYVDEYGFPAIIEILGRIVDRTSEIMNAQLPPKTGTKYLILTGKFRSPHKIVAAAVKIQCVLSYTVPGEDEVVLDMDALENINAAIDEDQYTNQRDFHGHWQKTRCAYVYKRAEEAKNQIEGPHRAIQDLWSRLKDNAVESIRSFMEDEYDDIVRKSCEVILYELVW